ncbi:PREDICTED: sister chromatid cohesion protein PDS5 homolog A-like isoform X1 [Lupinus angustifolius]|uniref:sister chromatid cohesion protein PDS5 homolog A-like isoform X1 n=1 Tax=Lupinus angustifolius TaxID=3871 RepID=UPI00092FABE0|nr:PREDICTED: sister chromatid cohesion protein PDS5 homolog A-like isoform X1 [Lupinus angustifolius]
MAHNQIQNQNPLLHLKDLGSKLHTLPSSKDSLIKLLKQASTCLAELDQSPSASILDPIKPFFNAIVKPELLKHQDRDVKLLVATCISEITRITAPEAPYSDDVLKDTFQLIVSTFSGLSDTNGPSFGRRVFILETLAKYRSCVVMLDLECDDLVNEMFSTFFVVARDDHRESVLSSMQTIMTVLLEESEDVREDLLYILLSKLGREKKGVTMAARRLAMNVIQQCVVKLEPSIKEFLLSLISGDIKPVNSLVEYHGIIYDLYCCAPLVLSGVLPYVTGELLTDQLETRLKAVKLVGDIIAISGPSIPEALQPIFLEFLKRLTDRVVEVRMSVLEHVKSCLLSNPFRAEAPQIISALCERLLDFDENVRKQVVVVICDVACHAPNAVPLETVKFVADRLRDKSLLVKKYTMERLAEIYRVFCQKSSDTVNPNEYGWIPGKILRSFFDKDFRSDIIESIICGSLFPAEFSISDIVKHWVGIFSGFDKVEIKALEKIMEQKQRLQQEMQAYLSLRQFCKGKNDSEVQKKILFCFRVMSHLFANPIKAEESFRILDQLKDANIWKILTNIVDPKTTFNQARIYRDDLLKILGEKHRLYEFMNTFSMKCSYLLFNKEHVKAILSETVAQKSALNSQCIQSCMDILLIIARFSPLLLNGSEEELLNLLKDDNHMIKEGVLHVLVKAGSTIHEQLAMTSSSVDLVLEKLCLEGSRRQAKYAVHALVAITKDNGLKSLSVLYKKLVDILEEKAHLPPVLQSLGCIAQTAMPIFETRESEIVEFINKILKSDSKEEYHKSASWDDKSDLCMLKIYGIKTLVKSYLPVKDAHVRPNINSLLDILRNMLSYGEISKDLQSSSVDKAHLRLASAKAVLRLSRLWDHKIPVDLFHLTLRASKISFPQAKKVFLSKVHQYIKDRLLDAKYACAFLFNIFGSKAEEFAEDRQNLAEIIQMHHQAKSRQLSVQSDANSLTTYPEYILPYLIHALAHNSCPHVDECKDVGAYDNIYRQLHLILSMMVQRNEDHKSEVTSNREKENISIIASIFHYIKHSEDIVDSSKSKNSHAICDLGLAITKQIVQKDVDLQGLSASVSLPPMLYKTYESNEADDTLVSGVNTWLADETVLTHFESLDLEMVQSQLAEDEVPKDNEFDGNEMPLGKMLKQIKSQRTSVKKLKKNKSVSAETEKDDQDIDNLNLVRQIKLNNCGLSSNSEPSNGHEHCSSKDAPKDAENATGQKRKSRETKDIPVPKHWRSSCTNLILSSSTSKASRRVPGEDSPGIKLLLGSEFNPDLDSNATQINMAEDSDEDLLVSSLKQNVKGSGQYHNDETGKPDEHEMKSSDNLKLSDRTASNYSKSSIDSTKKYKRKSISGLAKCMTRGHEIDNEDLIGCRVKVWWPTDKKFYRGTLKSYDPLKGKHVILYDDGDVEILRLEKECWELVDKGHKSIKKIKPSSVKSSGKKCKASGGAPHKTTKKIVNGKQSPMKPVNRTKKCELKSNFDQEDAKETSEISNPEVIMTPKSDGMNSGGSEEVELVESLDEIITMEKKTKISKAVSRRKRIKEAKFLSYIEESEPANKDYGERLSEDRLHVTQGGQNVDEESSSEEREVYEASGALREIINGEEESDTEGYQGDSNVGVSPRKMKKSHIRPSSPDETRITEIADDVPLSKWKQRTGKKSRGKRQ